MEFKNRDLPDNWQLKPIREVYEFTKKPRGLIIREDKSVPFLPMAAIPIGQVRVSVYEERIASSLTSGTYVENGDLLVAKITPSFENGKQAILDWDQPFGFATTEVIPIKEVKGVSDKLFLFHLLLHPAIRADLAGKMEGTTGRQRLSKDVLGTRLIPFPPLPEQTKIADVLGAVQRAMEQQERLLSLNVELKRAVLHQLFTRGLRGEPQKQTDLGPLPESWKVVKLGSLANFQTGKLNSNAAKHDGKFPFFTCSQETFWIDQYAFDTEALLLSGNNAQGIYSVKHFKGKFNAYQRTYVITLKDETSVPYSFMHQALSRNLERLRMLSIGTSTKYLTMGVLENLPIPMPEYDEAKNIGEQLRVLEKKREHVAQKRALLGDLFRTLLHQLITAQIRVRDLELKTYT
ncbi:MAG: restriction endonuclease subunit S [Pyrinomonadaceae bacterium]